MGDVSLFGAETGRDSYGKKSLHLGSLLSNWRARLTKRRVFTTC
jgi:hypothetical protein